MRLIRGLHTIKKTDQGCVITIGNFDGMHLGHRELIKETLSIAKAKEVKATVMLFEPQPCEYFLKEKAPPRLMQLREKTQALEMLGVHQVIILPFNEKMANCSAEQFIDVILLEQLDARYLVAGDDFRFGKERKGSLILLQKKGIEVKTIQPKFIKGQRVSSTLIREALKRDHLKHAEQLLGQPFSISGCVRHGRKQGRILGFPTANLRLHRKNVPVLGVYVVLVQLNGKKYQGVANVGIRPTIGGTRTLLEVHLFDFSQDIYGQSIDVQFIHKLRNEHQFESFDALKAQIFKDVEEAKQFLGV